MNIYENGFINLEYDPTSDILTVDLPPVDDILLPEIRRSFDLIVEHVRNYDVKKLLINATDTQVEVKEDAFTSIISDFVRGLLTTRVQKIARIVSSSSMKENVVNEVFGEKKLTMEFQSFTEIAPAIEWLKQ